MDVHTVIMEAAARLAKERQADQITYADIAAAAGVHWTTVRRHVGGKEQLRMMLQDKQAEWGMPNNDTRTRILNAAAAVFAKNGYSGATLDQISAEAGQTKGAVYWHFSNKDDLYLAICERSLRRDLQSIPQRAEMILEASRPTEALAEWLTSQLEGLQAAPEMPKLFFEFLLSERNPAVKSRMERLFADFYAKVGEIFSDLQARGWLRSDVEPKSLAVYVQTVINGLILSWLTAPQETELASFTKDAARMLWSGCGGREG